MTFSHSLPHAYIAHTQLNTCGSFNSVFFTLLHFHFIQCTCNDHVLKIVLKSALQVLRPAQHLIEPTITAADDYNHTAKSENHQNTTAFNAKGFIPESKQTP